MSFNPVQSTGTGTNVGSNDPLTRTPARKRTRKESGIDEQETTTRVGQVVIDENGRILKTAATDPLPQINSPQDQENRQIRHVENMSVENPVEEAPSTPQRVVHLRIGNVSELALSLPSRRPQDVTVRSKLISVGKEIKTLAFMCKEQNFPSQLDVSHAWLKFDNLMHDDNEVRKFTKQLGDKCAHEIASIIFYCGQLANHRLLVANVTSMQSLVTCLNAQPNLTAKQISIAIYGLGKLARAQHMNGALDATIVNLLLLKLTRFPHVDEFIISDIFQGLGFLVQAGCIDDVLDVTLINLLLTQLTNCRNFDGQKIGIVLYGLALMVQEKGLDNLPDTSQVNMLLISLARTRYRDVQNITTSLYSLGCLAQANGLNEMLDVAAVNTILHQLTSEPNLPATGICEVIYGLGLLAAGQGLNDAVDAGLVKFFLAEACNHSREVRSGKLCDLIYGLGLLANAKCLNGNQCFNETVDAMTINRILTKLIHSHDLEVQKFDNLFNGLKLLALAQGINGKIEATLLSSLFDLLWRINKAPIPIIGQLLSAVASLAQAGNLEGKISSEQINRLLAILAKSSNLKMDDADSILEGLKFLNQSKGIAGEIDKDLLKPLLMKSSRFQVYLMMRAPNPESNFSLLPRELVELIFEIMLNEM